MNRYGFLRFPRKAKKALDTVKNYYAYGVLFPEIRLDASTACQLHCPSCARNASWSKDTFKRGVGFGHLSLGNFRNLLDKNPWIKHIELSNYGEIFLNPELKDIIECAYKKNVVLTAKQGANLNTADEETLESLVKYKLKTLKVSIDGATPETYRIYRKGGDFEQVIENVRRINYYKRRHNSVFPNLIWQLVVFGHNEHEIPMAKKISKELDMEFSPKMNSDNWNPSYSPIKNKDFVKRETGWDVTSREQFRQKYKKNFKNPCGQFWCSPQINWDGRLLGCCMNIWSDFGNVFESGLVDCLKSEKYLYAKQMILREKEPKEGVECWNCNFYKNRAVDKNIQMLRPMLTLIEKSF